MQFKLEQHPTEKATDGKPATATKPATKPRPAKSSVLLREFLYAAPRIRKEFMMSSNRAFPHIFFIKKKPDLLVKIGSVIDRKEWAEHHLKWENHCAFEFKFGYDAVNSMETNKLRGQLTEMKRQYPDIPLYLIVINEPAPREDSGQAIPILILSQMFGLAQELGIRHRYVDDIRSGRFAEKVFGLIRSPPSTEIDLGQKFVVKSSGSYFNRELQIEPGITVKIADKIEMHYNCWDKFTLDLRMWRKRGASEIEQFYLIMRNCFTNEKGRFMKQNMLKVFRRIEGK